MECIVCRQNIKSGEQIFWGSQMICCGHGEVDCSSFDAADGLMGGIHLICLERPAAAVVTPNTLAPEPGVEESIVKRSDALALLIGLNDE